MTAEPTPRSERLPTPLHVVVVHRDEPDRCATTVAALLAEGPGVTVTIIDSGSTLQAAARLRMLLPACDIVDAGRNVGFGPGANIGWRDWLQHGDGEWVAVAPHDAVVAPGCLKTLLQEATDRPDAGLLSAEFGTDFDLVPTVDWILGGYYLPAVRATGWQDVDYAHGTLLLARRALLEEVGLFDERYFAYGEEVDLSLRARRAGWRVGMVWGAVVSNDKLPDQLLADYLQTRNALLLVRSHFGRYAASVHTVLALARMIGRARSDRSRARVHIGLQLRALVDFGRSRFGPPPPAVVARACAGELLRTARGCTSDPLVT